jgi:hypothetical protein
MKKTASEWAMLKPRSSEWNAAWKAMAERTGDADFVAMDDQTGEVWQYMGTVRRSRTAWEHEFRHRAHPTMRCRVYLTVPASKGWKPAVTARVDP